MLHLHHNACHRLLVRQLIMAPSIFNFSAWHQNVFWIKSPQGLIPMADGFRHFEGGNAMSATGT
jgi:hypothetical protein